MNLDEYLKTVGDYADQVAAAERQASQRSMDAARAMDAMFESGEWVAEWLEQKPAPKRPTNKWDPADRNRFIAWQAWKLQQAGRRDVSRVRKWQLMEAARVARSVNGLQILQQDKALHPLFWMRKNLYGDRIPEVWAIAVQLAGGDPTKVTTTHTREALAQWKKAKHGTRRDGTPRKTASAINQAANAAGLAKRRRAELMREISEMYTWASINEKARDEFQGFLSDLDTFLDEHAADQVTAA